MGFSWLPVQEGRVFFRHLVVVLLENDQEACHPQSPSHTHCGLLENGGQLLTQKKIGEHGAAGTCDAGTKRARNLRR